MKEAILKPLGMAKASLDLNATAFQGRAQDLATGYDKELKPSARRRYTGTAGLSLYAAPRDMAQFVLAFIRENPMPGVEGQYLV
jgi:CubicO group peptidase (beta-lactamase class C family)